MNGIKTYIHRSPKTEYPKDKASLYLTDVFGLELTNNLARRPPLPPNLFILTISHTRLLADGFARNGFKVYVPEFFEGDPVPPTAFGPVHHSTQLRRPSLLVIRTVHSRDQVTISRSVSQTAALSTLESVCVKSSWDSRSGA